MKLSISGSHSVGKTTLINALEGYLATIGIKSMIIEEQPRLLCELLNEDDRLSSDKNTIFTQLSLSLLQITQEQEILKANNISDSVLLLDRGVLDHWAYTSIMYRKILNDDKLFILLQNRMIQYSRTFYDAICYVPIEFDLVKDNIRREEIDFQSDVDQMIHELIFESEIEIIEVSGSVHERVQRLGNFIKSNRKKFSEQPS